MANGNGENGGTIKVSWGITLQVTAILIAVGIAWGTLSAKQTEIDRSQSELRNKVSELNGIVNTLQISIVKLQVALDRHKRASEDDQ